MKTIAGVIGSILLGLVVFFGMETAGYVNYTFWAPKYADAERNVFEHTHSYTKGMIQELQSMEFDYEKTTDPAAKAALGAIILHRTADFPEDELPSDLARFVRSLRK